MTKTILFYFLVSFGLTGSSFGQESNLRMPLPSGPQLQWQEMEFYLFVHFGPNTFTGKEWGKGTEPETLFNPTNFDAFQWARIAKAAGAKGIIITAKHHDGFCLWPSSFSGHTVRQSIWQDGRGDVLRNLAAACRKYGLKLGVYMSPWDRNHPAYGSAAYNDVFIEMMKEVVKAYGPLFEFWWDGANGEGPNGKKQVYDFKRFEMVMRTIAPGTVIFSDIGPDIRWVGNEQGIGGETNWNLLDTAGFARGVGAPPSDTLKCGNVFGKNWMPAECDVSIRPGWFYHAAEDSLVKSPEQLFKLYLKSVGRGANLLLNVPPDQRGLFTKFDSAALIGFKELRDRNFGRSLAGRPDAEIRTSLATSDVRLLIDGDDQTYVSLGPDFRKQFIEIRFRKAKWINCVVIQEPLQLGQRVQSFSVQLKLADGSISSINQTTIGHKRILTFPSRQIKEIRLLVSEAKSIPLISEMSVYRIDDNLIE